MKLPDFEYAAPATVGEAVQLLASRPGEAKLLAGGQSLLPTMAFRLAQPGLLVDLRKVQDLNYIRIDPSGVRIGARTRWRDIEDSRELAAAHPLLVEAISHVAHYQVRNLGTVGGSLAHADPASEMPCVAATCEARMLAVGPAGERWISAADFFAGPLTTTLADDEVLVQVHLPPWPADRRWAFQEFSRRQGDFALAGVALFYDLDSQQRAVNARIGVVGACQCAGRLPQAEQALEGRQVDAQTIQAVAAAAAQAANPPADLHASAQYRKGLLATLVGRALEQAAHRPV